MEVSPGYKLTEVGVIPGDWEVKTIDSLTPLNKKYGIVDGPFGSNLKTIHYRKSGIPIISSGYVTNGTFRADEYLYVDKDKFKQEIRSAVNAGDIVMAKIGARCGASAILPIDHQVGILSGNALKISIDENRYSTFYIWQFLWWLYVAGNLDCLRTTGAQPAISMTGLKKLCVPLPPTKAEQEAIAEVLSGADGLIESSEQLISKKRHLKQGAMQQLLTPRKGWYTKKLEDVADVIDPHPSHRAPAIVPNGIPFVGIGDLNENGDLIGSRIRTVDASVFDEHQSRYCLNDELIGLGRVASIGKVVKLKNTGVKYAISPTLGIIRGTKVRREYLLHALKARGVADQFTRIMSGSTRSSVGMVVLRKLDISLPREETDQTRIASILSDMDAEIAAVEVKLAKYRFIKQGMMHNLLTGRIRLV